MKCLYMRYGINMLLEINFTLVLFATSFLVFIYLVNLTLYKPVGDVVELRKKLIDSEYTKAKELIHKANESLENYQTKIKTARKESQAIVHEATKQAQKAKEEKVSQLLVSLTKEKEESFKKIEEEKKIVMQKLEKEIKILTDLITNKILGTGDKTLVSSH